MNFSYGPFPNFYLLTVLWTQRKSATECPFTNCGTVEGWVVTAKTGTYYGSERRFCTFASCWGSIWGKNLNRTVRISTLFKINFLHLRNWIIRHIAIEYNFIIIMLTLQHIAYFPVFKCRRIQNGINFFSCNLMLLHLRTQSVIMYRVNQKYVQHDIHCDCNYGPPCHNSLS